MSMVSPRGWWRLTVSFLWLKQRDHRACLNALCFCHNGRAFGGFAHLLQHINLSILHNTVLLHNLNNRISSWYLLALAAQSQELSQSVPLVFPLFLFVFVILVFTSSVLRSVRLNSSYSALTSLSFYCESFLKGFCTFFPPLYTVAHHWTAYITSGAAPFLFWQEKKKSD